MYNDIYINYCLKELTINVTRSEKGQFTITHHKLPNLYAEGKTIDDGIDKLCAIIREKFKNGSWGIYADNRLTIKKLKGLL